MRKAPGILFDGDGKTLILLEITLNMGGGCALNILILLELL
jgi:hypothetical protein